jgi:hypothetical protein
MYILETEEDNGLEAGKRERFETGECGPRRMVRVEKWNSSTPDSE